MNKNAYIMGYTGMHKESNWITDALKSQKANLRDGNAMLHRLAAANPNFAKDYPGLWNEMQQFKDVRAPTKLGRIMEDYRLPIPTPDFKAMGNWAKSVTGITPQNHLSLGQFKQMGNI